MAKASNRRSSRTARKGQVKVTAAQLAARTAVDGIRSLRQEIDTRETGRKRDRDALSRALGLLESEYFRVVSARHAATGSSAPRALGRMPMRRGDGAAAGPAEAIAEPVRPDVAFVPTPPELIDALLDLGAVTSDDIVYDLGSGDGRLVVAAAARRGARGVGIDIDPERIRESRAHAVDEGVTDRVEFVERDLFAADVREATVVMLYLLDEINLRLRQVFLETLRPGTRIVSHVYDMGDWEPTERREIDGRQLFLWVVPERETPA